MTPTTLLRRHLLTLESSRVLVNIEISVHTECGDVQIRRIFFIGPDPLSCNWLVELPTVRAAAVEPRRAQLRAVIERIRERHNAALRPRIALWRHGARLT